MADAAYDVPAAGSDAAGLEGFAVAGASGRLGRVAALNRRPDGLVLVVDSGDAYRAVPAAAIASIELRPRTVRLRPGAEAQTPPVEVRVLRADSPALVRHVPRELDRLLVEGDAAPVVVAGSILLWRELGAGDGRRLTRRERAGDALTLLLGITPRTRRRG